MIIYSLGSASIAFLTLLLTAIIFKEGMRSKSVIAYLLWSWNVAFWSIGYAVTLSGLYSYETTYAWNRVCHAFAAFIPSSYLYLTYVLTNKKNYVPIVVSGLISSSFAILCMGNILVDRLYPMGIFSYQPHGGPAYLSFFTYFVITTVYALLHLLSYLTKLTHQNRRSIKIFLIGSTIGYLGGMTLFFQALEIKVLPVGIFLIPIHLLAAFQSIREYGLFDIKFIFKKTIQYSIGTTLITLLYVLFAYFLRDWIGGGISNHVLFDFGLFMLIILTLKPLESILNQLLQLRFFKGTVDEIFRKNEHLESELERTQRLKSVGILAAGMAHEIRNPIQSLKTFGEYVEKKYEDKEFRLKLRNTIAKETNRIEKLTTELLEFSKPKDPKKESVDLIELMCETISLLEENLTKSNIKTSIEHASSPQVVNVDPNQIKQVFINIILNAKDAMINSTLKELTISIEEGAISIKDTGCGIPQEELPHLFDPFYTNKEKGTGLGLAITHSILTKNGANIQVTSQVGEGTTFIIDFTKVL